MGSELSPGTPAALVRSKDPSREQLQAHEKKDVECPGAEGEAVRQEGEGRSRCLPCTCLGKLGRKFISVAKESPC